MMIMILLMMVTMKKNMMIGRIKVKYDNAHDVDDEEDNANERQ